MRIHLAMAIALVVISNLPSRADQNADVAKKAPLRHPYEILHSHLLGELTGTGLSHADAELVANQSVADMYSCIEAFSEDAESVESAEYIVVRVGHGTTLMPKIPCVFDFLESAGVLNE